MKTLFSKRPQSGFTLIELLVVIAIIAILAAILFPVFAMVREKARQSSCASNEKQLALGFLQYTQDNDEKFPALYGGTFPGKYRWMDSIFPYVKSTAIYNCPDDLDTTHLYVNLPVDNQTIPSTATTPAAFGSYVASNVYWGNANNNPTDTANQWAGPTSMQQGNVNTSTSLRSPSTTFLLGDGSGAYQMAWQWNTNAPLGLDKSGKLPTLHGSTYTTTGAGAWEGALVFRHTNIVNCAFADAHVKAMTDSELLKKSKTVPTNAAIPGLVYFTRADD